VPFLVVLGDASWTRGNRSYKAGVHEVDELTAEAAKRTRMKSLLISKDEPVIMKKGRGPLTLDDIKLGVKGVQLENPIANLPPPEPGDLPRDYICEWCGSEFPSAGSRKRHIEFNHDLKTDG
jgi:hypothetical protein